MITDRLMEDADLPLLELSLSQDEHHKTTTPEFFQTPGTITKVYEDSHGPVLFARASVALRLDIQYVSNEDVERNKAVMLDGFPKLVAKAKENGYSEIIFNSQSRALRLFVRRYFKFEESAGEMRLIL
jgi:hypothetical protein